MIDPEPNDAAEVLRARARALARPAAATSRAGDGAFEVVEFRLAAERYAVRRADVREVYPLKDLTRLPGTPPFMLGVINVRGHVLPVIDLKKFFELPDAGITDLHTVIVVHHGDIEVGILADAVVGIEELVPADLEPSLPTLTGIRAEYLKGVTSKQVALLDVSRMLSDPKLIVDDEASTLAAG